MSQVRIDGLMPKGRLLESGHLACPGCAAPLAMKLALNALGPKTVVVLPACCYTIISGPWPQSSLQVPVFHTAFATGPAVASGVRAALDLQGQQDTTVMVWVGDGGTFDIGLQALSGAAERNENILYVCYDNEAYMNTGIQRSSATPWGAWTTTTPAQFPEATNKKDILAIMAAHNIPYAATATPAYPADFIEKVNKAKAMRGTRFLHVLSPCPPGWKCGDDEGLELARMAVQARIFPLLEVENGQQWRFTMEHEHEPVQPYLKRQGRFKHLSDEMIVHIQAEIDARYEALAKRMGGLAAV